MVYTTTFHGGEGDTVDHTPAAAVSAGDIVVIGDRVGHAPKDIAASALGQLRVRGVVTCPKATGTGEAIADGKIVYWDATNEVATETASTHKVIGKTIAAAGDDDATVDVNLNEMAT